MTIVTAVLSTLAGYAFGTMRFRGSDALFYLLLIGLIFPYEATVIPLYYVFRDVGLTDSLWALILPQIGLSVPFGTFWMRAFFRSTPSSLVEASRLDGASSFVDAVARAAAAGVAGDHDDARARLHVDVERVPARARDDPVRRPAHRAARARAVRRRQPRHAGHHARRRRRGARRAAGR